MKKKLIVAVVFVYLAALLLGTVGVGASESFDTYTYASNGQVLNSPAAYTASKLVSADDMKLSRYTEAYKAKYKQYAINALGKDETDAENLAKAEADKMKTLLNPKDIMTDERGYVYIADTGHNRIVVLNDSYEFKMSIDIFSSTVADYDTFSKPEGLFVNEDYIFVCDTEKSRLVMFNREDGSFYKIINQPSSPLFGTGEVIYTPIACAVDKYGRIYVVASSCTKGVIVMADEDGEFTGFIGAQKVTYSAIDIFWRRFQDAEQRAAQLQFVPTTFNNITVDADGFIYVTNSSIDETKQQSAIKSKNADYSPVKKLNSGGTEIMNRNGFFDCGGEVITTLGAATTVDDGGVGFGVSKIVDVAMGPEGSWSIIDQVRSRVYTYDSNGELLFAFGGKGTTLGTISTLQGITYQGSNMLLLDYTSNCMTVFTRTSYGDLLIDALAKENNREYADAADMWIDILQRNNNFDAAYIGIGKALFRQGKYEEAMEYLKAPLETDFYSKAYAELRKEWISKYFVLLLVIIVAALVLVIKVLGIAKKFNAKRALKVGKKTYWEELVYAFHLPFHPFDGFWDLKHEKRGSVRAGLTIAGLAVVAFYYQTIGRGYIFNPRESTSSILIQIIAIFVPILLWTTANWCLTTLFDGEGSFKDILTAVCYSLAPLPPLVILSTILTNVLTKNEGAITTLLVSIAYIWAGFLIFFGMLVTHDYSLPKNIITTLGTIVSMCVIMFVLVLFSSLVGKMIQFVASIVTEIGYRI